jgi:molecular chaperone GrpE (heat shock protein)
LSGAVADPAEVAGPAARTPSSVDGERIVELEAEVSELRRELETLRQQFANFQKQFQ